jgi:hypothetical protein
VKEGECDRSIMHAFMYENGTIRPAEIVLRRGRIRKKDVL